MHATLLGKSFLFRCKSLVIRDLALTDLQADEWPCIQVLSQTQRNSLELYMTFEVIQVHFSKFCLETPIAEFVLKVTVPTPEMRQSMLNAAVGDDVFDVSTFSLK